MIDLLDKNGKLTLAGRYFSTDVRSLLEEHLRNMLDANLNPVHMRKIIDNIVSLSLSKDKG